MKGHLSLRAQLLWLTAHGRHAALPAHWLPQKRDKGVGHGYTIGAGSRTCPSICFPAAVTTLLGLRMPLHEHRITINLQSHGPGRGGSGLGGQHTLVLRDKRMQVQATLKCPHKQTKIQTGSYSIPWPKVLPG